MRFLSCDFETGLIQSGLPAPRLVCMSVADGRLAGLFGREEALSLLESLLRDPNTTTIWHFAPFDLAVFVRERPHLLELVFDAFDSGRILCTKIRAQLIDVAEGEMKFLRPARDANGQAIRGEDGQVIIKKNAGYGLDALCARYLGIVVKKGEDTWRTRYAELADVPVADWPAAAQKYALRDAKVDWLLYQDQERRLRKLERNAKGFAKPLQELDEEVRQTATSWCLYLATCWGLRADPAAAEDLRQRLEAVRDSLVGDLIKSKIYWVGEKDGKLHRSLKKVRERVVAAYEARGEDAPISPPKRGKKPTGNIAYDGDTLKGSGDPILLAAEKLEKVTKLLGSFVPAVERAARMPSCTRYNTIVENGRTSAAGVRKKKGGIDDGLNIQQLPRDLPRNDFEGFKEIKEGGGVRECFIARPGYVLIICDFSQLELCTLAQVCLDLLGWSTMAEAIKKNLDLHIMTANSITPGCIGYEDTYKRYKAGEPLIKQMRQISKPINFGYPGGLGPDSFVKYLRGNVKDEVWAQLCAEGFNRDVANDWRNGWFSTFPEMRPYFKLVGDLVKAGGEEAKIRQLRSGRLRGRVRFCQVANGWFSSLAADLAKDSVRRIARECYVDRSSPLYGSRSWAFVHDENVVEVPIAAIGPERAMRAGERTQQIMVEAAKQWCPDVPIKASLAMSYRWSKNAEEKRVGGLLVPCDEPVHRLELEAPRAA